MFWHQKWQKLGSGQKLIIKITQVRSQEIVKTREVTENHGPQVTQKIAEYQHGRASAAAKEPVRSRACPS